jgi:hypothetical protein
MGGGKSVDIAEEIRNSKDLRNIDLEKACTVKTKGKGEWV